MLIDELMEEIYENSFALRSEILEGSTPVVSFGDFTKARIATLGINPSPLEFVNRRGKLLGPGEKRLTDLETLQLPIEDFFSSRSKIEEVWKGCKEYFSEDRNPYWGWFGPLEELLLHSGNSYKNGSACHLDLSPIATRRTYGRLGEAEKFMLVTGFRRILEKQLINSQISVVVFNGLTVFRTLQFAQNVNWHSPEQLSYKSNGRKLTSRLLIGESGTGQSFLGWTVNIQAFRGTGIEREELLTILNNWVQDKL